MEAVELHAWPMHPMDRLRQDPDVIVVECETEEDWHDARRSVLTASDAAVLADKSNFKGRYRLTADKMGLLSDADREPTELQRAGHYMEPVIAKWYSDDTGAMVYDPGPYTLIMNRRYPGIAATLDRITYDPRLGWGVLELKNRDSHTNEDWSYGVPETVAMQMQVQMLVTGFRWGAGAVLIGGNKFLYGHVMEHRRYQLSLVKRVVQFWRDVREGLLPVPGEHPDDNAAFNEAYPNDNGDAMLLPAEFRNIFEELKFIAEEKKALSKQEEALKGIVKGVLKETTYGRGPGFEFSLKSQTTKPKITIEVGDDEEAVIAALQSNGIKYKKSKPTTSRVLRSKETK